MSKARAYSVDNAPAREEDAVGEAAHSEPNGNLARVYGAPTGGETAVRPGMPSITG